MYSKLASSLLLILSFSSLYAQTVSGIVKNEQGLPLDDAHIYVKEVDRTTITNEQGEFEIDVPDLSTRTVNIVVTRLGYESLKKVIGINDFTHFTLKEMVYESETMVVTATRTQKDVEEVSIPVTVLTNKEIRRSGSMRVSDILSEQTGLQIVNDHGTGIQVQGFDADYTLIMIDGNPVIGRTAGILDLSRLSVRNIKQVEIVKGPSSALWGSDALAGVINIITGQNYRPFSAGLTTRYGENNTLDLSGNVSLNTKKWSNNFFINRNTSAGYKLEPDAISQTVPEFETHTFSYKTSVDISDDLTLDGNIRFFTASQNNKASISNELDEDLILITEDSQNDFMAKPTLSYKPFSRLDLTLSWLFSNYKTNSGSRYLETGNNYETTTFRQYYNKPELQAGYRWSIHHHTVLGGGLIQERLKADRYPGQPDFTTQFVFAQHSWIPNQNFELTGGFRYDDHSAYSSQFSPKLSSRYKLNDRIQFRLSVGKGFKAPDFRQLFLDFNNSTEGYSVFGAGTVEEGIKKLSDEGQLSQILIPLQNLADIQAESSWAVNFGFDIDPTDAIRLRVNLFRNNVSDMIETAPIARKTNGQNVFTYFNVEEVFTQGMETEIRFRFNENVHTSLGYQLLDANRRIEKDRTVQNEQGEVVEITEISYRPMFNRSRHSGNVKVFYENENGWGANIRGILRGKYGLLDANGNGFVNNNEYENGYVLWNTAAYKKFDNGLTFQLGVDNASGYTDSNQSNLPGRLWYAQISLEL